MKNVFKNIKVKRISLIAFGVVMIVFVWLLKSLVLVRDVNFFTVMGTITGVVLIICGIIYKEENAKV